MSDDYASLRIGERLRGLRKARGLSLQAVASRAGISVATLSRVETDQTLVSAHNLFYLARALDVDLTALFEPDATPLSKGVRAYTPDGGAVRMDTARYTAHVLCTELANKRMHPCINEIEATSLDAAGGLTRHAGEEFIYVLDGVLELHTEAYAPLTMRAGDSVYFDSDMPHAYVCATDDATRVLVVTTAGPSPEEALGGELVEMRT